MSVAKWHPGDWRFLVAGLLLMACGRTVERADLILRNGRIVTVDARLPVAEALAIQGDTILAVGSEEEVGVHRGENTEVVDLKGQLVVPGFIESHAHFLALGASLQQLDLSGSQDFEEVVDRVRRRARTVGTKRWIVGRGWNQEKWERPPEPQVEGLPVHTALSSAAPDNPVVLIHASGHSLLANARAMARAGITPATPDPPGGLILRDSSGNPTGAFLENAVALLTEKVVHEDFDAEKLALAAAKECVSKGITSLQDAGSGFEDLRVFRRLVDEGRLLLRLWVMLREPNERIAAAAGGGKVINYGDKRLTVRAIKRVADGALGSHGAWLLEPYADLPGSTGFNTSPLNEIERSAEIAVSHGLQLAVHAIGDRANREVLQLFERVFKRHPGLTDPRWRIEHAQHIDPVDVPRLARLGVIPSVQPIQCTSDGPWLARRLGRERAERTSYVWRDLIDAGAMVISGTDAPVEDIDPIANFYAAVTRRMEDGQAFTPGQRMSRMEALESLTIHAARAAFEEEIKGSLTPGKLADIAILSQDITTVDAEKIRDTKVTRTLVGGQTVYTRNSFHMAGGGVAPSAPAVSPPTRSVVIEGVPHIRQKPDFCGEACAAMYLQKLGEEVDQDYVFDRSELDPALGRGVYAKELKRALENIGFDVGKVWTPLAAGEDGSRAFAALHSDLVRGIPSIVCMYYSDEPETTQHFRLILGYEAETDEVIYHEPAEENGAYRRMKREMFLKLWPLRWQDKRTIVRMRLDPRSLEYGQRAAGFTAADFAQEVMRLRPKIPEGFHVVVEPPFVVIGDDTPTTVKAHTVRTVRLATSVLKKDFFPEDPKEIIAIWLFKDDASYRRYTRLIFHESPSTPYGYYSERWRALIMNIATGGGTLIHEMVHAFMGANVTDCPPWLNEGLGSLYEGVDLKGGHLVGILNWRLPGLQEAIADRGLPPFKALTALDEEGFYNRDPGTHYAQSRYLLYYLQENDLLFDFYRAFLKGQRSDPTGYRALKQTLHESNMTRFQEKWEQWVLTLGQAN